MSPAMSIGAPPRVPQPVHNFGTLAVHAGSPHDSTSGAVIEAVRSLDSFCPRKALLLIFV